MEPTVSLADRIIAFLENLRFALPHSAPKGVQILNPYRDARTLGYCKAFYHTFYHDSQPRTLLLGINPGRFGSGLTGVAFTDPIKLAQRCGIANDLPQRAELSANFIYQVIDGYGGPAAFYRQFYIGAVCPLGFTLDGRNLNYYDLKWLQKAVYPFAAESIRRQLDFGLNRRIAFALGMGKNLDFLLKMNAEFKFFDAIEALPHPRFIMQYRRKAAGDYARQYIERLRAGAPQ